MEKYNSSLIYDDGEEKDLFDTLESPGYSSSWTGEDKSFAENMRFLSRMVEAVLNEDLETRDCLKELFTRKYVDDLIKLPESGGFLSFASEEIIRAKTKGEKLPDQYEIWQKYNQEIAVPSAGSSVSRALKKLEESLRIKLRELREEYLSQKS
jgi:hypothetical protein